MRVVRGVVAAMLALGATAGCDRVFGLHDHSADAGSDVDGSVVAPTLWASVSGGTQHSCGIHIDHSLWCWGRNDDGQLGLGSDVVEVDVPTQVGADAWSSVSSGGVHTCGIKMDGTLWCWGDDYYGQLGNGSDATVFVPTQVGSATYASVATGFLHTCAIDTGSAMWCFGDDESGEAGDGPQPSGTYYLSPVQVPSGDAWASVAVSGESTCAIDAAQMLWCWGDDSYGEIGEGDTMPVDGPTMIGSAGDTWQKVVAGHEFFCALTVDAKLRCWGEDEAGQLGEDTLDGADMPTPVSHDDSTWLDVATGADHVCGLHPDRSLWCWGSNETGQLIGDTLPYSFRTVPGEVTAPSGRWLAVAAGDQHTCAIDSSNQLWCGGLNGGNLGVPGGGSRVVPTPIAGATATTIAAGILTTCAIAGSGSASTLSCWGYNANGSVGDGTTDNRSTPTPVSTAKTGWTEVAVGDHACAIGSGGAMYCWGYNGYGGVGTGDNQPQLAPVLVTGGAVQWKHVATDNQTCAVSAIGYLYCWGYNAQGQCGQPPSDAILMPTFIGAAGWTAIGVGDQSSCGISSAGVECWGADDYGELGFVGGDTATPTVATVTGPPFTNLTVGGLHACVDANGSDSCWGDDYNGELGNQTTQGGAMPSPVIGSWLMLSAGDHFTCGIKSDSGTAGTLWCWGANEFGELGDGTFIEHHEPQQVGSGSAWTAVSAGYQHACALDSGNNTYCWGRNLEGEIGDGEGWLYALSLVH